MRLVHRKLDKNHKLSRLKKLGLSEEQIVQAIDKLCNCHFVYKEDGIDSDQHGFPAYSVVETPLTEDMEEFPFYSFCHNERNMSIRDMLASLTVKELKELVAKTNCPLPGRPVS